MFSAFLHFDISFMVWVILGALAPFIMTDAGLTGENLQVTPSAAITKAGQYTLVVKAADPAKHQPGNVYNLLIKPGAPGVATRSSVKPVEAFVVNNADPATLDAVNARSRLIHVQLGSGAKGNPNENVVPLSPMSTLVAAGHSSQPVANGYPSSTKLTLIGIPLLAAGFWRIMIGILVDRLGARKVGIASLFVTLLPLLLGWQSATSYGMLVCVGIFLGVAGASFAVALPLASRWYPPEMQGIAMGIAGAGNSGTVLATIAAPLLAQRFGWHGVFGLLAIPVALTLVIFTLLAKEPPRTSPPLRAVDFKAVLASTDLWRFCLLYFVTFGGFVGLSTFANTFFVDQFDAPKAAVGLWTWPFIVAGSLLRPVGGALADRFGGLRMLTILYGVVLAASVGVALFVHSFPATCLLLLFLMGALGMGNGSVFQLVPQRFKNEVGVVTGLVGAAGGVGGYYLNFALGHLHDATGTYASGFVAVGAITIIAMATLKTAPNWSAIFSEPSRRLAPLPVGTPAASMD
ncbi:Nitrate/nitrite transporter [Fimbriimonas ginsengisoli Gsoil 348]|uniref:Nitrate/nitrite transporter n=1 Tax=Fimbriimonas ginsengisoli Gsoil 348 TaxID=661478 RepID=A0A068NRX2_FIMGI|nr:Nitrate/nitrite transporter [Fimbriimonas ginsengisoli Gsoil 348]